MKSEFDKHCGKVPHQLVVLDSLNYIKGYRYELHCIAKAAGETHGVVWLLCEENIAKRWNDERRRQGEECYSDEMRLELIMRYEPPDQRNRWDKPLWRININSTLDPSLRTKEDTTTGSAQEILEKSVYNMHSLSDAIADDSQAKAVTKKSSFKRAAGASSRFRRNIPTESTETALMGTNDQNQQEVPTASANSTIAAKQEVKKMIDLIDDLLDSLLLDVQPLREGLSTKIQSSAAPDVLHDVDAISKKCMNSFFQAQKVQLPSSGGGTLKVSIGSPDEGNTYSMSLKRSVTLAEMKRYRRQYIRWVATNPPKDTTEMGISTSWLSYIENNL